MCGKRKDEGERWEGDALVVCVGRGEMGMVKGRGGKVMP